MSIWTTVRQEVTEGVEGLRKGLTEILDVTEDLTRRGKIKLEIQSCRNVLRDHLADLGTRFYRLVAEENSQNFLEDPELKALFARIDEIKTRIETYEAELAKMKGTEEEPADSGPLVPATDSRGGEPAE